MSSATAGSSVQPGAEATERASRRAWIGYLEAYAPYLLALYVFVSALYGVDKTDIVDTDAARHAMNGAFIYDLIRTGHLLHPITYAKIYYSHLPSLSMPFHPPMFPAIEAVFFALFGVKLLTARLVVALCVGISAFLLYRLVLFTSRRPVVAACATVTTFSLWTSQFVARDVMLEFPALVFMLAAIYCLRDFRNSYPLGRALGFAVFASAAVWTKQHTVFLGAIPFLEIVLVRRWRRLLEFPIWISSALFGAAVIGLIWFSKLFHGTGVDQMSTSSRDIYYIFTSTLPAYFHWITEDLVGLPGVLLLCALAAYLLGLRRRDGEKAYLSLYVTWTLAAVVLLVDLGPISRRYLFFVLPAVTTIAYTWLFQGCRRLWDERRAGIVAGAFAVAFLVSGFAIPFDFLRGPGAAAQVVVDGKPARVLYAGDADGNFTFAIRTLDPKLQITVIPAIKLPPDVLKMGIADLCRRYGIEWVVFEHGTLQRPWSRFKNELPAVAQLQRSIPLESSRFRWRHGTIDVYRFAGVVDHPGSVLQLPVPKINEDIPVKL